MPDGPTDPGGSSSAPKSKHKERHRDAGRSIEAERIRAWEKLASKHGAAYCDSPEAPPGYREWYTDRTRRAAEESRRHRSRRGDTPSTSASNGGGSVPPTPDYYSNDSGIPFPVEDHWDNGGYGYHDPYTGSGPYQQQQPRQQQAPAPAPVVQPSSAGGVAVGQDMVNRLFESVMRTNERSTDMAATALNKAFERNEGYRGRGKRSFQSGRHQQDRPSKIAKREVTENEAVKLRMRIDCGLVTFEAGGKPPLLSNRDLDVITPEQQKRLADENARRARAAEQRQQQEATAPGSEAAPIQVSDADASGEDEEMRDETVVPEVPPGAPVPPPVQPEAVPE